MPLVASFAKVDGDGVLRGNARRQRAHDFASLQRGGEAARRDPSDAVAGGQRFGERAAVQHPSVAVEGLGGLGTAAEVQLGVHVVLDERGIVFLQQRDQLLLRVFRQERAPGILEVRHQPARAHRILLKDAGQRCDIRSLPGTIGISIARRRSASIACRHP